MGIDFIKSNIEIATLVFIFWNFIVFMTYGLDKMKAIKKVRRVSEKTLVLLAFFMGGIGAMLGMSIFRHKTKHLKFKICVPLAIVVNIAIVFLLLFY